MNVPTYHGPRALKEENGRLRLTSRLGDCGILDPDNFDLSPLLLDAHALTPFLSSHTVDPPPAGCIQLVPARSCVTITSVIYRDTLLLSTGQGKARQTSKEFERSRCQATDRVLQPSAFSHPLVRWRANRLLGSLHLTMSCHVVPCRPACTQREETRKM